MAFGLPTPPSPGKDIPRAWMLDFYNAVQAFMRNPVTGDGKTIIASGRTLSVIRQPPRGAGVSFSGTAYSTAGHPITGLNSDGTKPWIRYNKSERVFTQQTGPPSAPWPDNEHWWEKAYTVGDIHASE